MSFKLGSIFKNQDIEFQNTINLETVVVVKSVSSKKNHFSF